jgi:hypothetical protein
VHVIVINEAHLRRILSSYFTYYHEARPHLSLECCAPVPRRVEHPSEGRVIPIPQVGGLHHRYRRAANPLEPLRLGRPSRLMYARAFRNRRLSRQNVPSSLCPGRWWQPGAHANSPLEAYGSTRITLSGTTADVGPDGRITVHGGGRFRRLRGRPRLRQY